MDLSKFNPVTSAVCGWKHKGREVYLEPNERSGHRMICDRNYVYVVGGFSSSPSAHLYEEIWRFNILTDKWEKMKINPDEFPHEMASHALCTDLPSGSNFSRAFMFGGTSFPFGDEPSNNVHVLDRLTNGTFIWRQLNTIGETPIRQYGSSIVFHKNILYLIGGTTGQVYNIEVHSLSPVNLNNNGDLPTVWEWKLLEDGSGSGLTGRYRHEVAVVNDDILIFGGGNAQWVTDLDKILTFSIKDKCFRALFTYPDGKYGYPQGRMCHACLQYEGRIYVIGGCSAIDQETQCATLFDDIWELDTLTLKWRKMASTLSAKMCFHGATVTEDGCIYVFGGALDGQFRTRCNLLQRMWLRPPSLQYLCERAVLKLFPVLRNNSIDELVLSDPQKLWRIVFGFHPDESDEFHTFIGNLSNIKQRVFDW